MRPSILFITTVICSNIFARQQQEPPQLLPAADSMVFSGSCNSWRRVIYPLGENRCRVLEYSGNQLRSSSYLNLNAHSFVSSDYGFQQSDLDSEQVFYNENGSIREKKIFKEGNLIKTDYYQNARMHMVTWHKSESRYDFDKVEYYNGQEIQKRFTLFDTFVMEELFKKGKVIKKNKSSRYYIQWIPLDRKKKREYRITRNSWEGTFKREIRDTKKKTFTTTVFYLNGKMADSIFSNISAQGERFAFHYTEDGNLEYRIKKAGEKVIYFFTELGKAKDVVIVRNLNLDHTGIQYNIGNGIGDSVQLYVESEYLYIQQYKNGIRQQEKKGRISELRSSVKRLFENERFNDLTKDDATALLGFSGLFTDETGDYFDKNEFDLSVFDKDGYITRYQGYYGRNRINLTFDSGQCREFIMPSVEQVFEDKDLATCMYGLRTPNGWLTPSRFEDIEVVNRFYQGNPADRFLFAAHTHDSIYYLNPDGSLFFGIKKSQQDLIYRLRETEMKMLNTSQKYVLEEKDSTRYALFDLAHRLIYEFRTKSFQNLPVKNYGGFHYQRNDSMIIHPWHGKEIAVPDASNLFYQLPEKNIYILYNDDTRKDYLLKYVRGNTVKYYKYFGYIGDTSLHLLTDTSMDNLNTETGEISTLFKFDPFSEDENYGYRFKYKRFNKDGVYKYKGKFGKVDPVLEIPILPAVYDTLIYPVFKRNGYWGILDQSGKTELFSDAEMVTMAGYRRGESRYILAKRNGIYSVYLSDSRKLLATGGDLALVNQYNERILHLFKNNKRIWTDTFYSNSVSRKIYTGSDTNTYEMVVHPETQKIGLMKHDKILLDAVYDKIAEENRMPDHLIYDDLEGKPLVYKLQKNNQNYFYYVQTQRLVETASYPLQKSIADYTAGRSADGRLHLSTCEGEIPIPENSTTLYISDQFLATTTAFPKDENDYHFAANRWHLKNVKNNVTCKMPLRNPNCIEYFAQKYFIIQDTSGFFHIVNDSFLDKIYRTYDNLYRTDWNSGKNLLGKTGDSLYFISLEYDKLFPVKNEKMMTDSRGLWSFGNSSCSFTNISTGETLSSEKYLTEYFSINSGYFENNNADKMLLLKSNFNSLLNRYNSSRELLQIGDYLYESENHYFPDRGFYLDSLKKKRLAAEEEERIRNEKLKLNHITINPGNAETNMELSESVSMDGDAIAAPTMMDAGPDYESDDNIAPSRHENIIHSSELADAPKKINFYQVSGYSQDYSIQSPQLAPWQHMTRYAYSNSLNLFFDTTDMQVYVFDLYTLLDKNKIAELNSKLFDKFKVIPKLNFPCSQGTDLVYYFNSRFYINEDGVYFAADAHHNYLIGFEELKPFSNTVNWKRIIGN